MDPNQNLVQQEELLKRLDALSDKDRDTRLPFPLDTIQLRRELSELRSALSIWLGQGGVQPQWEKAPRASRFYGHLIPSV